MSANKKSMRKTSRRSNMRKSRKSCKMGGNIVATAAVPFGLVALQRFLNSRKKRSTLTRRR